MSFEGSWAVLSVRLAQVVPMIVASATIGFATPAFAAGTTAGTNINNTATANFTDPGGTPQTVNSNTVTLRVDEVLDVTVARADPGTVTVTPGSTDRVLAFDVRNTGNGPESFTFAPQGTIGGDQFDPTTTSIVIDTNNNGVYDAGIDAVYTLGSPSPAIAPDTTQRMFVLSSIPAGQADGDRGDVDLTATAVTGSGPAGTVFAGQGQGGGDAVVGNSTAIDTDRNGYVVQSATIGFVKSASIADTFGGTRPLPNAIITYTLVATITGSGTLTNLRISDVVPAETDYQAGSITLQGAPLTDADDADAGEITGTTIAVRFGNVPGGQTRTVTFRARIR